MDKHPALSRFTQDDWDQILKVINEEHSVTHVYSRVVALHQIKDFYLKDKPTRESASGAEFKLHNILIDLLGVPMDRVPLMIKVLKDPTSVRDAYIRYDHIKQAILQYRLRTGR